jgi:hypothetical protein
MMSHRNEQRDEPRSSTRHNRQQIQHRTTHRTQHHRSPSAQNIDRFSLPVNYLRSGGYGKYLDLFIQLNVKENDVDIR